MKHACHFLEELNVVGFTGCHYEVEFIMCLVKNASNLKKLITDTIHPVYVGVSYESRISETSHPHFLEVRGREAKAREARAHARNMEARMPLGIKIIVL